MAMRYDEVNQLAVSKASRSAAIDDWVVVRIEMFVAVVKVRSSIFRMVCGIFTEHDFC